MTKGLGNFENKQPNRTILFIFVFQLSVIDSILSKIVGFDQLWTAVQQKLVTANRKLVFFEMPNTFWCFIVQNCRYFLPCWSSQGDSHWGYICLKIHDYKILDDLEQPNPSKKVDVFSAETRRKVKHFQRWCFQRWKILQNTETT